MKFKNGLLIVLLIIGLISIASVSASEIDDATISLEDDVNIAVDDDSNQIVDLEDSLSESSQETIKEESLSELSQETTNEETLSESSQEAIKEENKEILAASEEAAQEDDGSFTALQNKILNAKKGDTITLYKDYTYNQGFDPKGIQILKDITINGNGHSLNGLSQSRILLIHYGLIHSNRVVLNNIKFINGNTDLYGGAIFNYGNLTVNKCVFTNNKAKYCGGAINSVGYLNLKNSKFTANTAGGDAGAVFSFTIDKSVEFYNDLYKDKKPVGKMEFLDNLPFNLSFKIGTDHISNCTFSKNIAKGRGGGAIYGFTNLYISSSKFTSNKASEHGGAVFANKNLTIKNSKFTSNKVSKNGGAVYFRCHERGSSYENNKWVSKMKYYSATISKCVFTKNTAKKGGAIYGFIDVASDKKRMKVIKCNFSDNKATKGRDVLGGTTSKCIYKYIKLTSKNKVIKKTAKKFTLSVKLSKGKAVLKNKKIRFKFRGKTYTAKTNKKGIAKVIIKKSVIKKLKAGKKYTVKISYLKKSIKRTVKVKK